MALWPTSRRFTLLITFDLDAESAEYRLGADPAKLSRGRFAVRRGVDKVLGVLKVYGLKTVFFTPGWVAEHYPKLISKIASDGHEIGAHGYLHEKLDELSPEEEEKVFEHTEKAIEKTVGLRPAGFRAPYWRLSGRTLEVLARRGYRYDSSLMDDENPYIIRCNNRYLVELPVDWRLDDWPYLERHRTLTPGELAEMWLEEIEYAAENGGFLTLTMHPQCIGRGARLKVLEEIIREAIKLDAWMPKPIELVDYVNQHREKFSVVSC